MSAATMTIHGLAAATHASFDVLNPATEEPLAEAPECTEEQLDAALRSNVAAYDGWRADESFRRERLRAVAGRIRGAVDELASLLTAEQGKPLDDARREVERTAVWYDYFADLELPREVIQDDAAGHAEVVRRPLGPVAAITPWNFPLAMAAWKLAPALRVGNTVTLKPSPYTPLTSLRLGELLRDVLPPGTLNVVSGGDAVGAWLARHPATRKVSFTGSIAAGKSVAAAAAPDLKRLTLELGGNDPAILLEDADVAGLAPRLFWGAFANNGQVCSAIKRVYVPEAIYDDVVDALAAEAEAVPVGDGAEPGTRLGPVNNPDQLERVSELVGDARRAGATVVAGGRRLEREGYFFAPTVIAGARDGMRIVDEEQFGPALPVVPYRDVEDVVRQANVGHFGLSGSVWAADADRAADVAARLDCGTTWVNTHGVVAPHQPFGGARWSGLGVENGSWGLYGYTELQVVYRARA